MATWDVTHQESAAELKAADREIKRPEKQLQLGRDAVEQECADVDREAAAALGEAAHLHAAITGTAMASMAAGPQLP